MSLDEQVGLDMRVLEVVLVDLEGNQMHETLVEDVFVVADW